MSHDFVRGQSVAETCFSHWGYKDTIILVQTLFPSDGRGDVHNKPGAVSPHLSVTITKLTRHELHDNNLTVCTPMPV